MISELDQTKTVMFDALQVLKRNYLKLTVAEQLLIKPVIQALTHALISFLEEP